MRIVALCSLVSLLDGYDLQTMAFLIPTLSAKWGVAPAEFRLVLSASLIGLAVGALTAGPLSDRFGRRRVLLTSLAMLMLSTFSSAGAGSLEAMFVWRFATGLGLGGSLPNVIALTAEYAPLRNRVLMLSLMLCGLPLGGALGGQVAAEVIALYGWQSLFFIGGAVPLLLLGAMFHWLPESIKFLAGRPGRDAELQAILRRIRPDMSIPEGALLTVGQTEVDSAPVAGLFQEARAPGTVLLWIIFFLNLFALYYLSSWMPTVLHSADWTNKQALQGSAVFHYGGLAGGLFLSWLIDRLSPYRVLTVTYVFTCIAVWGIGVLSREIELAFAVLALAGSGIIGAQFCLNALAASFYPTRIRATGVGWALGIGRLGAIVSPFAGGAVIAAAWPAPSFFGVAAVPMLVCAACVLLMGRLVRGGFS